MRALRALPLFMLMTPLFGCGHQVVGWPADPVRPTVTSTVPDDGDGGVATDAAIHANFSQFMDPLAFNANTFVVRDAENTTTVAGARSYDGVTATFTPSAPLEGNTQYVATVSGDVTNTDGVAMASDYEWTFRTTVNPSPLLPTVLFTSPDTDETDVATSSVISAVFSLWMDPLTLTDATFIVMDGTTEVEGEVTSSEAIAWFAPTTALDPGTEYDVTITTGVESTNGDAMAADYTWTFTTADVSVGLLPLVISTWPEDGDTDVPLDAWVTASFNMLMDPLTLTDATFVVMDGLVEVEGDVTYAGTTATFAPLVELDPNTEYVATITTGVESADGQALADETTWTFTTTVELDLPYVIETDPADLDEGVPLDTWITATFSEAMALLSITDQSFLVIDDLLDPVAGTVTYDEQTLTATFVPDLELAQDTEYTATITTAATDLALNGMFEDYVWTFTTASDPPIVIITDPLDLAIDVPLDTTVNATFNVDMDANTITELSFLLTDLENNEITGQVDYDALTQTATLTPDADLTPLTYYRATVTTDASDLSGQGLLSNYTWTFATEASPLGLAYPFGIASTAGVTNTGATTINGDVVLDPNTTCNAVTIGSAGTIGSCNGFAPTVNGEVISPLYPDAGFTSGMVKDALRQAYIDFSPAAMPGATPIAAGTTLGAPAGNAMVEGDNLFYAGVYQSITTILITGDLTLDAEGDPNATFVFQSSGTIGTAATGQADPHTRILLVGGAKAANVYWQAGGAATLGTYTEFQGNILAYSDITMETGATSCGRLFAGASTDGAFVLDNNIVSVPGQCP